MGLLGTAACGGSAALPIPSATPTTELIGPGGIRLARRNRPVTLPIYDDNKSIASGLAPETGSTFNIYTYKDYIYTKLTDAFGKQYGVPVALTTFSSMDEASARLSTGALHFDMIVGLERFVLANFVAGKLIQPLNLSYIPNLAANVWPSLVSPFYDVGSRYTVPYAVVTTGIAWRRDFIREDPYALSNPYDLFWKDTYAKGKVSVLNDRREAMAMAMLHRGITDVNTEDPKNILLAKQDLTELINLVNVKIVNSDYQAIPAGTSWLHQAWSGDMVYAASLLRKGTTAEVLGYWYPPNGGGVVANDTLAVMRGAANPVLAHLFLNYMLDPANAIANYVNFTGYQPPQKTIDPDKLVAQNVVPANLKSVIVRPSDFDKGYDILELTTHGQQLYQQAWAAFRAGK
jgi:spermidine/putrescine transport system substrate-binding protein